MHKLNMTGLCACVASVLTVTGCATTTWKDNKSPINCNPIVHELEGHGMNRQEALNDAISTAMAYQLGAYTTSETVLSGSDLVVNRRGQATRGSVDKAVAIGAPVINPDQSITLRTRVSLCRNAIKPEEQTPPSDYIGNGQMQARSQAMLDISDSRSSASLRKKRDLAHALSALLNPQVGPQLHHTQVISYKAVDISPSPGSQIRNTAPSYSSKQNTYVLFNVEARVAIDQTVRHDLQTQLNNIAVGQQSPGIFGHRYAEMVGRPGLVSVDQRFEHKDNPALHRSDRRHLSSAGKDRLPTDKIANVTIIKGLTETTKDDAGILRMQIIAATKAFSTRGLSLIGWSQSNQPVMQLPLFHSIGNKDAQIMKIAFYPETRKGGIHRANGVVFVSPHPEELMWLSDNVSPLSVLSGIQPNGDMLALRRGESRLEINLAIHRDIGSRISRFTLQPTRSLHTSFRNGLLK